MTSSIARAFKIVLCAAALLPVRSSFAAASSADAASAESAPPAGKSPAASAAAPAAAAALASVAGTMTLGASFGGVPVVVQGAVAAVPDDQARAPEKLLSPALVDGINDVATFGPGAAEVSVYSLRGRLVFHGVQRAGVPIVWNGKDAGDRVDESGVYVARIRKTDSGIVYQSFVLVK